MFGALAVAFFVGLQLNGLVALRWLGTTREDVLNSQLTWGISIGQYVSYIPILIVLVWGLPWLARRSLFDLGLRGFDRRTIVWGLIGFVAMYVVTIGIAGVQYSFTHEKPEEAALALFTSTHDRPLIASFTILAAIVAPFMEEFAYRGFLYNAFARYMPVWVAATISGAIFGISHGSLSAFLPLAGSGAVLALVYARSRSLTASMLTHALFNIVNVTLLALGKT